MIVFSNFTNNFIATFHKDKKIRLFDIENFSIVDEIRVEDPLSHL